MQINRDRCVVVWRTKEAEQAVEVWRETTRREEYDENSAGQIFRLLQHWYVYHVVNANGDLVSEELARVVMRRYLEIFNERFRQFHKANSGVIFGVPEEIYYIAD